MKGVLEQVSKALELNIITDERKVWLASTEASGTLLFSNGLYFGMITDGKGN